MFLFLATSIAVQSIIVYIYATCVVAINVLNHTSSAIDTNSFIDNNIHWIDLISSIVIFAMLYPTWSKTHKTLAIYNGNNMAFTTVALLIGAGIGLCNVYACLIAITDLVRFFPSYENVAEMLYSGGIPIQILSTGIVGPIVEEICFRGIIFNRLRYWTPTWVAILISSSLFGIFHMNLFQGLYAVPIGMILALVYIRFRNILAPIIVHIAFNLASIILNFVLTATDNEDLSKWVILFPSALILVVCAWLLIKQPIPTHAGVEH